MSVLFRFGIFEADPANARLTRNGVRVRLQDQPFRVLVLLLQRAGEVVTRDELRAQLWPAGTFVDFDGSLNAALKRLRTALGDDADNPRFIETVPKRGYRFLAPVVAGAALIPLAPPPAPVAVPASAKNGPAAPRRLWPVGAALIAVVLLSAVMWRNRGATPASLATTHRRRALAVLGFQNASQQPADAWMATAIPEMLRTELAGGNQLRVVPGEDIAQFGPAAPWTTTDSLSAPSAARLGAALNSDLLVLGAYAELGATLRLDLRLQDSRTGELLYTAASTGTSQQLPLLVTQLGAALRRRLDLPLLPENAGAALPPSLDAQRTYALALERMQANDVAAAKDLLLETVRVAPGFEPAHLLLARAWGALGYDQNARRESAEAVRLSAALPQTDQLLARAASFDALRDPQSAAAAWRALCALDPGNLDYAVQLIAALNSAARREEALTVVADLRRLPPPSSADPRIDFWQAKLLSYSDGAAARPYMDRAVANAAANRQQLLYAHFRLEQCLGDVYGDTPQVAPARCQEAYKIFLAAGNRVQAADALRIQADRNGSAGDWDAALDLYQRALALLHGLDEHEKTGAVLNNMAILEEDQGQLAASARLFEQARQHFAACNDQLNVATALVNLGDVAMARGQLAAAAARYSAALALGRVVNPHGIEYPLFSLAKVRLEQGDPDTARRLALQALAVARARNPASDAVSQSLLVAGDISAALGDLEGAKQEYQLALGEWQKLNDRGSVAEGSLALANLALDQGAAPQTVADLRAALAQFRAEKSLPDEVRAQTALVHALRLQGRLAEAAALAADARRLSAATPDPAIQIPLAIETARVAPSSGSLAALAAAEHSASDRGYVSLALDARLASAELELPLRPARARSELLSLAADAHARGLARLATRAQA
ncbi:MAG TPA: winged helix-turn-helix domain-containing protein, partial [Terriglobales bacterium]|nr:winged helix-turn-helix domain-containing protein [Terriglobales bacterium]